MLARSLIAGVLLGVLYTGTATASIPPPLPPPVATFDVGSLRVTQYGSGPQTLIFIPGLTCGPWEWSGEIANFAPHYTIYALTLPGFDGQPPITGPLFQTVTADFWNLLRQRHIVKPIVIGHSLGGTLSFMLAEQHPELLGGVVSLDGLPFFPSNVVSSPEQIRQSADALAAQMAALTPAQFSAGVAQTLSSMITSPSDIAVVAPLVARSDPTATGRWFAEDMLLDLRPQLPSATVPILLIAPYDASVDARYGMANIDAKRAFYAGLVKGAPNVRIVMIDHSRHFAMYDQPQALLDAITQFLANSP